MYLKVALMVGGRAGIKSKIAAYDKCLRANQLFYDKVLLHMGEAPSALTTGMQITFLYPRSSLYIIKQI